MINSFNVFVISLYKARCWPGARIDANRGKRSYEWKMDTLVRQNKRKEKVKGAEKRFEEMHRERQRSVSSRHRSRVSISPRFISVQSITDFDRGFYLSIFYYFLAPLEYRSSMGLIRVHYLLGVEMVWFMVEGIVINCGRNFAAIFYKELHLHKVQFITDIFNSFFFFFFKA